MKSLDAIEERVISNSDSKSRVVRGLWGVDCCFNPKNNGRVFDYKFLVAQTIGQGCAYGDDYGLSRDNIINFVGKDFADCDMSNATIKVSLLDSMYGEMFPCKNKETLHKDADSYTKSKWRVSIIYEEAMKLLGDRKGGVVVNVGVVGGILKKFHEEGYDAIGADFGADIVDTKLFGAVPVVHGSKTNEVLRNADLAIISGMTITTHTIDDIIYCCAKNNVKTIVFAETGANFADYYVNNGIDVYLSEHFPFYIFNGHSKIDVCRGTPQF